MHARPNIVLIMADDMGYSDLGCFGGTGTYESRFLSQLRLNNIDAEWMPSSGRWRGYATGTTGACGSWRPR